jgi:dienelactone hydrolase
MKKLNNNISELSDLTLKWVLNVLLPCSLFFLLGSPVSLHAQQIDYQTKGHTDMLPVFYKKLTARQTFPLSWVNSGKGDFELWKQTARAKVTECLMSAPPFIPFDAVVIAQEDRGTYIAQKIAFNVTGDSRVLALILIPKSAEPHPAVLLLHDHGGKFDIGKEKVIKPFDLPAAKMKSAKDWIKIYYGNRYIGDELAKKGYVCMAVDMFNWSDRSGENPYENQQALASNFLNMGASWPGLIAYEDMRAAAFLAQYKSVDSARIAAMGLSVGGYRTWQIAALSPHIAAGVSVCWMTTHAATMVPGNNQTGGQSAFSMLHPGLSQFLDYADVASIACPKPMMFCNGNNDALFPMQSIKEAYDKMKTVWDAQNAGDKLVTKLYNAPHEFNLSMQQDAFTWLESVFKKPLSNK